jgi:hypothetical protein
VVAVVDAVVAATVVVAAVAMTATGAERDDTTTGAGQGLQVYGDSAYGTGEARAAYARGGHDTVIKPKPLLPAVPGGFTLDDFTVDEQARTVTCPGGHTGTMSAKRAVTFGTLCAGCPLRHRCTTATDGRSMSIHEHQQLLRAARGRPAPQFRDYPVDRGTDHRLVKQRGRASNCATTASTRTTPGYATGPPRSTCVPSSPLASPAATEPGRWPDGKVCRQRPR